MTRREMTVDEQCYDLAADWLSGEEFPTKKRRLRATRSLAQAIQRAIEDWMEGEDENPREKGDDDGQEYGHPGDALAERL